MNLNLSPTLAVVATRQDAASRSYPAVVTHVRCVSYATPNDGGGALYRRHTPVAGHATENMEWTFASADGTRWILDSDDVRPEMLGADGTGSADSTAALNAAFFAHVYLTKTMVMDGVYRCASQVTWINDKFGTKYPWMGEDYAARPSIVGRGLNNSYIRFDDAVPSPCMRIGGGGAGWTYSFRMEDVSIVGKKSLAGDVILKIGDDNAWFRHAALRLHVVNQVNTGPATTIDARNVFYSDLDLRASSWGGNWPTTGCVGISMFRCFWNRVRMQVEKHDRAVLMSTQVNTNTFTGGRFEYNRVAVSSASETNEDNVFVGGGFHNNNHDVDSTAATRLVFRDCGHYGNRTSMVVNQGATDATYGGVGVSFFNAREFVGRVQPSAAYVAVPVPASGAWQQNVWRQPARVSIRGGDVTSVSVRRMAATSATTFPAPVVVSDGSDLVLTLTADEGISLTYGATAPAWVWQSAA